MKEPWPSAGGYKYPLFQEGQVIHLLRIHTLFCLLIPLLILASDCLAGTPPHLTQILPGASRDGPSLIR